MGRKPSKPKRRTSVGGKSAPKGPSRRPAGRGDAGRADKRRRDLRAEAERRVDRRPAESAPPPPEDVAELLHELEVHRTELEMQNEQLRRAQEELEASRDRYADLYDDAPVGYVTLDAAGIIREINLAGAGMLGRARPRLIGHPLAPHVVEQERRALRRHLRQCVTGRKRLTWETRLLTADGSPLAVELRSAPAHDRASGRTVCRTVITDVTDRRRATDQIRRLLRTARREKETLSAVIDSTADEIWFVDTQGRFVLANAPALREFALGRVEGADVGSFVSQLEILRPDGTPRPPEEAPPLRALAGEVVRNDEELVRTPASGELRHRQVSATPVRDAAGEVLGAVCVVRDVTDLKRAEEALRESERHFRLVTETIEDVFWMSTRGMGEMIYVSPGYERLWGRSPEHLYRSPESLLETVHPDDREECRRMLREHHAKGGPYEFEYRILRPDGAIRWIHERGYPVPGAPAGRRLMTGVCTDVTEARLAEEALRESERRLRDIFRAAENVALIQTDLAGRDARIEEFSPGAERIFGYRRDEVIGRPVAILHLPRDVPAFPKVLETMGRTRGGLTTEATLVRKSGERFPAILSTYPLFDADGEMTGALGVSVDITGRKRAERALRDALARLRLAMDSAGQGVWEWDYRTGLATFDEAALRMLGYGPDFAPRPGEWWLEQIHPDDRPAAVRAYEAFLAGEAPRYVVEFRLKRQDGDYVWVASTARVMRRDKDGSPELVVGVHTDITGRKRLQEQLSRAQKMEAVGRLAGGVAHDFRNQLTVIKWSAERLLREDLVAGEGREDAEEIVKAADASRAVTEQLLALGRREQLHPQLVDLGEVMGDLARALPAMVGPKVRVAVAAGDGGRPCPARVDPARLRQALANLVSNARDAMPDGGELTVRTACADVDESDARAHGVGPGRYAVLAVCDTGSGMDEATRSRIFEPFYTTKDAANGTGLGLPMVYAFVAQSGGFIEVDSAPGEGSTFRLHLPAARRAAPEAETPRGRPPADASDDRATRPDGKTGSMGTRR